MPAAASIPVGVIVAREDSDSRWEDHNWRPIAVFPGALPIDGWKELRRGEGWVHFHAATVDLELFRKESDAYKFNLEGREPVIYVVLSDEDEGDDEHPIGVHLVTASPYEAADYLDSGELVVEPVTMTEELFVFISEFVDEHHVEEKFIKRKRNEVELEDHKFGQEPIVDLRKRMKREH